MKLMYFQVGGNTRFGLAVGDYALSFEWLAQKCRTAPLGLDSVTAYLEGLPESFETAAALQKAALEMIETGDTSGMNRLSDVNILAPVPRPAALLDFALSPRHLICSAKTMMRHEFGPVKGALAAGIVARRIQKTARSEVLFYYKGNHFTVIGDHDEMGWPAYTSYLDIEPELAVVIGKGDRKIAGYVIFNDASARDVQFPEMTGMGPARAKDFARGNGLGPFLVTPDEISDPMALDVTVSVGDRYVWHGSTSEYVRRPEEVLAFCETIFPLFPGTVIGFGTIPGCTGLDNDLWIEPGEMIRMSFDGLGTLHQKVPDRLPRLLKSRWRERPELEKFMG